MTPNVHSWTENWFLHFTAANNGSTQVRSAFIQARPPRGTMHAVIVPASALNNSTATDTRYAPPSYPANERPNYDVNTQPVSAPSYSEVCEASQESRPGGRALRDVDIDIDGSCTSQERLLPREEPPPPYPGPGLHVNIDDLPPPPAYDEVTK